MSFFSHTHDSQHNQSMVFKRWSLIPEVVLALALGWFCFDLAFRLDGYQETYWMIDLDMLAVVVLIVGAGLLALMHHAQNAERKADEYPRQENHIPQFPVSDGGMGFPTKKAPNQQATKKPVESFDGGDFSNT